MSDLLGQIVGSYRIERELGRGGMGQVYVAEHTTIGKRAAVKVLLPARAADPDLVERFFNEARAAASIRHAGIVDVFDFGRDASGRSYLIMELLDGESLAERLKRGSVPIGRALDIARQVASALEASHAAGIVHRDLKPDNLFLVPDGAIASGLRVKILDFGIAKLGKRTAGSGTASDVIMGTPLYMAPEQCEGARDVDARADIYALGAILFEMATGKPPFHKGGPGAILSAHLHEPTPDPKSVAPDIPDQVQQLIVALLEKAPDRRPTAGELCTRLERLCEAHPPSRAPAPAHDALAATAPGGEKVVVASAPTAATDDALPPARRSRIVPVIASAVVLAGAGAATWYWLARRAHEPPLDAAALRALPLGELDQRCHHHQPAACEALGEKWVAQDEPAWDRAAVAFDAACDGGIADGCARLGAQYRVGIGVTLDADRAASFYKRACDGNSAAGCSALGDLATAGYAQPFDPAEGLRLRLKGCDLGAVAGCMAAADQLQYGLAGPPDRAKAAQLRHRAYVLADDGCKHDDMSSCRDLASFYEDGVEIAKDPVKSFALLRRACDANVAEACGELHELYVYGSRVEKDPAKALALAERACKLGSVSTCEAVGTMYAEGLLGEPDTERARRLLEDVCSKHGDQFCGNLAHLYDAGVGGPPDPVHGQQLMERACRAGRKDACGVAARQYELGVKGIARDAALATTLYEHGRALGDAISWMFSGDAAKAAGDHKTALARYEITCEIDDSACAPLADLLLDGDASVADPKRGIALFEKSCANGGALPCGYLGKRLRDGTGIARDTRRGLEYFIKACDLGLGNACFAAIDMLDGKHGIPADPSRATELTKRGCQLEPAQCPASAKRR